MSFSVTPTTAAPPSRYSDFAVRPRGDSGGTPEPLEKFADELSRYERPAKPVEKTDSAEPVSDSEAPVADQPETTVAEEAVDTETPDETVTTPVEQSETDSDALSEDELLETVIAALPVLPEDVGFVVRENATSINVGSESASQAEQSKPVQEQAAPLVQAPSIKLAANTPNDAPAAPSQTTPSLVAPVQEQTASQQQGDQPKHQPQPQVVQPLPQVTAPVVADQPAPQPDKAQPAALPAAALPASATPIADSALTLLPQTTETTTAQPVSQTSTAQTAERTDNEALNAARLARGLQSAVNQRGGSVTLRLTPPEMGTVRVQMQIQASRVTVQFHAESQQGSALLSQQLGQLRTTLEGQGLQVDRISVQTMQSTHAGNSSHTSSQQQDSSSQQQNTRADDGRSRGSFDRGHDPSREDRRRSDDQRSSFQQLFEQGKED